MTPEQRAFFQDRGYVLLRGALSQTRLRPVRERVLGELKRLGSGSSGQGIPASVRDLPTFQQIEKLSRLVDIPDLAAKVMSPQVEGAIEALAGGRASARQSQLLLSPPRQGPWRLDGLNWHTDLHSSQQQRRPGIQVFALLGDVEKHGGATLILSGSHLELHGSDSDRSIRNALRRGSVGERELEDRNLSIVELSGKAGDVYLMDMRLLHTPSVNASKRFRMVATVRCLPG